MQPRRALQEAVIEPRYDDRGQLSGGEVEALLVTADALAEDPDVHRLSGPLDGILIAVGVGSVIWAAAAWVLYALVL